MSGERSYTNKDGILVTVDENHLQTAVEIKQQLQELSSSRRCNWHKHKQFMEAEGFTNSCTCENYRCLIKDYQAKIGKLEKKAKESDIVENQSLESIQKEIGELYSQKKEAQVKINELNRIKREFSKLSIITEMIRDTLLDEIAWEIPPYAFQPLLPSNKHKAILIVTDFHIGATVKDINGNSYNFQIAKQRLNHLKKKTLDYCRVYGITDLYVVCLGDVCEHIFMRNITQSFEAEFPFAQQIVKASELLIDLLVSLATYVNVDFTGLAGNHDRMNGASKNDNIDGDNCMVIVNYMVRSFIELSQLPRLRMSEADDVLYSCVKEINGRKIKFFHGDLDSKRDSNKLDKHTQMDGIVYDAIVMGHYHHYHVIERNYGKMEIYIGSLMGRNQYSKKMKANSDASQGLILIHEDGEIQPIRIGLQIS